MFYTGTKLSNEKSKMSAPQWKNMWSMATSLFCKKENDLVLVGGNVGNNCCFFSSCSRIKIRMIVKKCCEVEQLPNRWNPAWPRLTARTRLWYSILLLDSNRWNSQSSPKPRCHLVLNRRYLLTPLRAKKLIILERCLSASYQYCLGTNQNFPLSVYRKFGRVDYS